MRPLVALFLALLIVLAGCSGATPAAVPTAAPAPSATPAALPPGQWPDFVLNNSARVQRAYRTALANPVAFTKIPCLCGCVHEPTDHRYLLDCFVKEICPDGSVVFDRHGAT
jgi:hypothetical protein